MLKRCAWVFVIAACGGGGAKKTVAHDTTMPTPAKSECAVMADHVADLALTFKDPPPTTKDVIAEMLRTRCESDAWSADAKKCFGAVADESGAESCIGMLSPDQRDKVTADAKARFGKPGPQGEDPVTPVTPDAPPPPQPAPITSEPRGSGGRCSPGTLNASGTCDCPAGYSNSGSPGSARCQVTAKSVGAPRAPSKAPAKPKAPPPKGGGGPKSGDPCEGGE